MIYDVKRNIYICIFVSKRRLSFVLEVRRRVLRFSKYNDKILLIMKWTCQTFENHSGTIFII